MSWRQFHIPNGDTFLFCDGFITGGAAMNIIVAHTPVVTTLALRQAYEPLARYGVNVFAFDFSGTGNSGGRERDFSRRSVLQDFDAVAAYVERNYSSDIHLYGSTGIGGMFAQYYACVSKKLRSFSQFACVDHGNTAGLGYPYPMAKLASLCLKALPNFRITVPPPPYSGYHADKDNGVYLALEHRYPNIWSCGTKILTAMLECFVAADSAVKAGPSAPTLVFKTLHDRFFSPTYFDSYYASLACKKKLVEINDTHNSYYFESGSFCRAVYEWALDHHLPTQCV